MGGESASPISEHNILSEHNIRLLILDVDGVLTDGTIVFDETGGQSRAFHIQDGLGLTLWKAIGRRAAILTSKQSGSTLARAKMLGIDLIEQGADDKLPGFERLLAAAGVDAAQTAYVGDDLLDAPVLRRVAYPITVPDAPAEVRAIARYVTSRPGGHGAVRDAVEHLLKREGAWTQAIAAIGADR
jgi:3-deoxy-D-manno-octulosonate 8-phosphate phosphatase (KDO 8-P phosphatase)